MTDLMEFEQKYELAMQNLRIALIAEKDLKNQIADLREFLIGKMDENGITNIDNEYVRITRVSATPGTKKLDEKAWRAAEPDEYNMVLARYNKVGGARKATVRIEAK